jgi:hypothetical protein
VRAIALTIVFAPVLSPGSTMAAEGADEGVFLYAETSGGYEVVHFAADGTKTVLFGWRADLAANGFAADPGRNRYAYRLTSDAPLLARVGEEEVELRDSERCVPDTFVTNRAWVAGTCSKTGKWTGEPSDRLVIWDQKSGQRLNEMQGYGDAAAVADDTVYFLRNAGNARVEVRRFVPTKSESTVASIRLSDESPGPYAIEGLVAWDATTFTYLVYDEHERRYYLPGRKPFFPGKVYPPIPREQSGLTFSKDGRFAAYTERRWNELTYLVVVDLPKRKRIETTVFGSFPKIAGGAVYFMSDPSFVRPRSRTFRQIGSFALFRYEIASGEVSQIATFVGDAETL